MVKKSRKYMRLKIVIWPHSIEHEKTNVCVCIAMYNNHNNNSTTNKFIDKRNREIWNNIYIYTYGEILVHGTRNDEIFLWESYINTSRGVRWFYACFKRRSIHIFIVWICKLAFDRVRELSGKQQPYSRTTIDKII